MEGANNSAVTIKAVSTFNGEITATKSINVTYKETVEELTSISIVGNTAISGQNYQFSIAYTPVNSAYKGITWSITKGSTYATINQLTGLLTILSGANNSEVTVKATSTHDNTIMATKDITVTYAEINWDLSKVWGAIDIEPSNLPNLMNTNDCGLYVEFANDSENLEVQGKNVVFTNNGLVPDHTYVDNSLSLFEYAKGSSVCFGWCGLYKNMGTTNVNVKPSTTGKYTYIFSRKVANNLAGNYFFANNQDMTDKNGAIETLGTPYASMTSISDFKKYLSFGFPAGNNITVVSDLASAIENSAQRAKMIEYSCKKAIKIKSFILAPGTYATKDEVIAARDSAYVDIRFNEDGQPYNAGSIGELLLCDAITA